MESQLLCEFIAFLKARWPARSRVDQRRRRLRQLVSMVRAVADAGECRAVRDGSLAAWLHVLRAEALRGQEVLEAPSCDAAAVAGSARRFLEGLRALFVRSTEMDRVSEAVEELERLAGPGGDLDMFVKVLGLEPAPARAMEMEVDGGAFHGGAWERRGEGSSSRTSSVADFARLGLGLGLPAAGGKRKRRAAISAADGDSSAHGNVEVDGTVQLPKRRVLAWMRPHQWLPAGLGGLFAAPRKQTPPPAAASRSRRARAVAKAMARIRRGISRRRQQEILGQRLSRIEL